MPFNIQKMLRQSKMEDKARVNGIPMTSAKELPMIVESHGAALSFFGGKRHDGRNGQRTIAVGGNPHEEPDNEHLHKTLGIYKREGHQNRRKQHNFQHPAAFDLPEQDQGNGHPKCSPVGIHCVQQTGISHRDAQRNGDLIQNAAEHKSRHGKHKAHHTEDRQSKIYFFHFVLLYNRGFLC